MMTHDQTRAVQMFAHAIVHGVENNSKVQKNREVKAARNLVWELLHETITDDQVNKMLPWSFE